MNLQLEIYLPNVETKREKYERINTFIIMFSYDLSFVQVLLIVIFLVHSAKQSCGNFLFISIILIFFLICEVYNVLLTFVVH